MPSRSIYLSLVDMQSSCKREKKTHFVDWEEFPFARNLLLLINNMCTFTFFQFSCCCCCCLCSTCSLLIAWETSQAQLIPSRAGPLTRKENPERETEVHQVSGSLNTTLFLPTQILTEKLLQCCHNALIESLNVGCMTCK